MPKFRDARGDEWHPRITCNTLSRFEEETGASLFDPEVVHQIQHGKSVLKMGKLLFLSCSHENGKRNLNYNEFMEGFESELQMQDAMLALGEALQLFFQKGAKSAAVQTAKAKSSGGDGETSSS